MGDKQWWQIIGRWAIFMSIVGGAIWFLSHYQQSSAVKGEKISIQTPPLAKKVLDVIPPKWRLQTEKQVGQWLDSKQRKLNKQEPWLQDIQRKLDQASQQISGFPHQSKKQIKKKLIRQACDELLREVDRE